MDYTGKICPYCKTPFKEGDDIVVCSVCEMPHHKDCWIENKACTTFGCTGTILGAEQAGISVGNAFCTKCGAPLSEGQRFCAVCGASADGTSAPPPSAPAAPSYASPTPTMQAYAPSATPTMQAYAPTPTPAYTSAPQSVPTYGFFGQQQADRDLLMFLRANQQTYISKFQKLKTANSKVSWNWCSFLFGGFWFAYRKMYGIAAMYLGIGLFTGMIPELGGILQLALWVCGGLFGNYFYMQYVDKELPIAKNMDEMSKNMYITKKGGTSVGAVFAVIGIAFGIGLIISGM